MRYPVSLVSQGPRAGRIATHAFYWECWGNLLFIIAFDYRSNVGFSFPQDVVNALQQGPTLFPDIPVSRLLLHLEIEDILSELVCFGELSGVRLRCDQRVKPAHLCGPFFD